MFFLEQKKHGTNLDLRCSKGFGLMGPSHFHCSFGEWDIKDAPECIPGPTHHSTSLHFPVKHNQLICGNTHYFPTVPQIFQALVICHNWIEAATRHVIDLARWWAMAWKWTTIVTEKLKKWHQADLQNAIWASGDPTNLHASFHLISMA